MGNIRPAVFPPEPADAGSNKNAWAGIMPAQAFRGRFVGSGPQTFLTKELGCSQVGHFFGLQRPSFSCPHFSHFQIAMSASFQASGFYDQNG
jgi:hypothetical protein